MTNQKRYQQHGIGWGWLLSAISIVTALGIWDALSFQELFSKERIVVPAQLPVGDSLTVPPLPTLVPLQSGLVITSSNDQTAQSVQLRDVVAPTTTYSASAPVQPVVINSAPVNVGSSSASVPGSSGSNVVIDPGTSTSGPVTSTSSSQP
jgi:hypothetical protein